MILEVPYKIIVTAMLDTETGEVYEVNEWPDIQPLEEGRVCEVASGEFHPVSASVAQAAYEQCDNVTWPGWIKR